MYINEIKVKTRVGFRLFQALRGVEEATIRPRRTRRTISLSMVLHIGKSVRRLLVFSWLFIPMHDYFGKWQAPSFTYLPCTMQ